MYDNFEPFEQLKVFEFEFESLSYKVWQGGNIINEKIQNIKLHFVPQEKSESAVEIHFSPSINEIESVIRFDIFMTSTDRLQYYIIPENSNANHPAIEMFKSFLGSTRGYMHFDERTPFCCNLFVKEGDVKKISFSFSNPVILIEFEQ